MGGSLPVCCRHWRGFSARSPAPTTARPHPHPPPPPSIFTPRSPSSTFRPHPHYEPARNDPPPSPPPTYPHASLPHPPSTFLTATPSTLHPPPSKGTCLGNELLARESAREGVASRVDMSTYINAVLRSAAWPSRHAQPRPPPPTLRAAHPPTSPPNPDPPPTTTNRPQRSHAHCACLQCSSINTSQVEEQLGPDLSHLGQLVAQRRSSGDSNAKLSRLSRYERAEQARDSSDAARESQSQRRKSSASAWGSSSSLSSQSQGKF